MKLIRKKSKTLIAENTRVADNFYTKLVGLMFKDDMPNCDAMIFQQCNSIHTFFMRFKIDVIFLNKKDQVVKIIRNMKPWRLTRMYFKASKCVEFKGGYLSELLEVGDEIEVKDV